MSIVFPSPTNWITPRVSLGQITTEECQIILNQKIDSIDKVLVKFGTFNLMCERALTTAPNPSNYDFNPQGYYAKFKGSEEYVQLGTDVDGLDITKYVVEYAKYQTFFVNNQYPNVSPPNKTNTFFFRHNDNVIEVVATRYANIIGIQNHAVIDTLLANAFRDIFEEDVYEKNADGTYSVRYATIEVPTRVINDPRSVFFRVYYIPLGESVKLNVPKTNPQPVKFSIPYSQSQEIVDNVTHGREMQSIANRTGCEKKQVLRTLTDIKQYRSPYGGYFWKEKDANGNLTGNIWKLTKCELTVLSSEYMRVVETWSKNWTYRSENVPINREYRSWNIPADIVQRDLLYQDYCLITRKDVSLPNDAIFSQVARGRLLLELTDHAALDEECNTMWFYTGEGNDRKGAVLSCSAFGFGNSLVFSGKTKDNLSAGVQRVPRDSGDSDYQFCKDVYYCQDDGKLEYMKVQIGTGTYSTDETVGAYLYPEFKREGTNYYNSFSSFTLLNEKNFKVLKDPSEQLNFTYQLHLLTDSGFLVIGATWAAENPLVKSQPKAKKIKVWKLTQNIASGAQVMIPLYGSVVSDPTNWFVANPTDQTIHFIPHDGAVGVCVTDENNAVLIAYNNDDEAIFTMKYTHSYKTLYAALHSNDPD